jgi:hypothetical protein
MLLGGGILAGFGGAVKTFTDMGSHLDTLSKETGVSVEALSTLGFAAEATGLSAETLEHSFRHMSREMREAYKGAGAATGTLTVLGLSAAQLKQLSPDEQFRRIGVALQGIPDPAIRSALAMKIFGRAGTELLPLFAEGAAGLAKLEARARELGVVFSGPEAKAAKEFRGALLELWAVVKMGVAQVGAALVPELKQVVIWLTSAAQTVVRFVRENRGIILVAAGVAAGIAAVGAALIGLGAVIQFVGAAFAFLATVVGAAIGVVSFLISPLGLIIAGVVAAGAAVLYFTGLGGRALGALGEVFGRVKTVAIGAWGGIKDAMAAGDLGLAARVAWSAVKLVVLENTQAIQMAWVNVVAFLRVVWANIKAGALTVWATIKNYVVSAVAVEIAYLKMLFAVVQWVFKGIVAVITGVVKVGAFLLAPLLKAAAAIGIKAADQAGAALAKATGQEANKPEEERQAIADRLKDELAQIEKERQAGIAGVGEGVAKAQEDYQNALSDAAQAAKDAAAKKAEPVTAAAAGAAYGPSGKIETQGTFSALAIFGMGGKHVLDSIAEYGQQTVQELKGVNSKLQSPNTAKFS